MKGRAPTGIRIGVAVAAALLLGGCSLVSRPVPPGTPTGPATPGARGDAPAPAVPRTSPDEVGAGWTEEGVASWYGNPFHGRQTASGEIYDMEAATAAHPFLPFGAVVEVENLRTGARTRLRINDRGPFVGGRVIDLSRRAAREIDLIGPGTGPVRITVLETPAPTRCWEVQVGAFQERENAVAAQARLEARGVRARWVEAPGGPYRVRAGPWTERGQAEAFQRGDGGVLLAC
jgi:rare lipoprotein A